MAGAGASIGGVIGGIGGSLLPGIGTGVGGAVGSGVGSFVDSVIAKRGSEASEPSMTDPTQTLLLDEIARRRKAIEQGTDVATQAGLSEVEETGAATRDALSRATGGNAGATVDALIKSQRMEDRNKGAVIGQQQTRIPFLQNMQEQLTDKIAQRTLDLTQFNRVNKNAQEAQFGKEAVTNLMAGTATGNYDPMFKGAGEAVEGVAEGVGAGGQKLMSSFVDMITKMREPKIEDTTKVMTDSMGQINQYNSLPDATKQGLNNPLLLKAFN